MNELMPLRHVAILCAAFARGDDESRAQLLAHPELVLRASAAEDAGKRDDPAQQLVREVGTVGGIARKALARVEGGVVQQLLPPERARLRRTVVGTRRDVEALVSAIAKETTNAG